MFKKGDLIVIGLLSIALIMVSVISFENIALKKKLRGAELYLSTVQGRSFFFRKNDPFPCFAWTTLSGESKRSEDIIANDSSALFVLFSLRCSSCYLQEIPFWRELYRVRNNLKVVFVSVDADPNKLKKLVADYKLENLEIGYVSSHAASSEIYGYITQPQYVLVKKGKIENVFVGSLTHGKILALAGVSPHDKANTDSLGNELYMPADLEVDNDSSIYVLDYGEKAIFVFDKDLNKRGVIGREGRGPGEFLDPSDLTIGWDNYLYVADPANSRISKFDKKGNIISTLRTKVPFMRIAADKEGFIYGCSTTGDYLIYKVTSKGNIVKKFGTPVEHKDFSLRQVINSGFLCVDNESNIYFAFKHFNSILKFNNNGEFLTKFKHKMPFKEKKVQDFQIARFNKRRFGIRMPVGFLCRRIICDGTHIYRVTTDTKAGVTLIEKFSKYGEFLKEYSLAAPTGVATIKGDYIYYVTYDPFPRLFKRKLEKKL